MFQQHTRQQAPASPSAPLLRPVPPALRTLSAARFGAHPLCKLALCAACVMVMVVYMHGTHHMVLAAKSMDAADASASSGAGPHAVHIGPHLGPQPARGGADAAAAAAGTHAQQQHSQQVQQPQGQQKRAPCAIEVNQNGVVELADSLFKYESPFIDTVGMRNPVFAQLPAEVILPLGPVAAAFWRDLAPAMQQLRFKGQREGNVMYNDCDAAVLYAFARLLKPARVFEVGSGFSTRVVRRALRANARDGAAPARHLCIEPFRHAMLADLGVEVVPRRIQEVELELFDELQAGDMLFLDNSHVTRPYGDVIFELLWILPRLKPGVFVHLHDIFLPYEYPEEWMVGELRPYTEQYMLAAFLYGNANWEVVFQPNEALKQVLSPIDQLAFITSVCGAAPGSSIYLRRKLPHAGEVQATR